MGKIVFVLGGARSGKSSYALRQATALPGRKVYVATAQAYDSEMSARIAMHRQERGPDWDTHEEPVRLGEAVQKVCADYDVIIIDCLTIWLSNLMCGTDGAGEEEKEMFLASLNGAKEKGPNLFVVSNEVGMGIVPENDLARRFRDMAGRLNQQVAQVADEVFLVVAGIPVRIK